MRRETLRALIEQRRYLPLAWGQRDCCLWAADYWLAVSGRDFAEGVRGYSNAFGAYRRLLRANFASVADLIATRLVRVRRVTAGTVVMTGQGPLHTLLIAESARLVWGQGERGLVSSVSPPGATFWEPA